MHKVRPVACAQVDMFSFGVVLWEMVTNQVPDLYSFGENIIGQHCRGDIADLITLCMDKDPDRRPSAIEAHQRILDRLALRTYLECGKCRVHVFGSDRY